MQKDIYAKQNKINLLIKNKFSQYAKALVSVLEHKISLSFTSSTT